MFEYCITGVSDDGTTESDTFVINVEPKPTLDIINPNPDIKLVAGEPSEFPIKPDTFEHSKDLPVTISNCILEDNNDI